MQIAVELEMPIDAGTLKELIDDELAHLLDARICIHIKGLLVEPKITLRKWDYGKPGEQYPCWAVLNDDNSKTGIAYCETGFGPKNPWGLVWLRSDKDEHMSMGMDCSWYPKFLDAYFESFAAAELPIWRVFKSRSSGVREPITDENSWEATWECMTEFRKADPTSCYTCDHAITYKC
jgi:hypothetical protein